MCKGYNKSAIHQIIFKKYALKFLHFVKKYYLCTRFKEK